MIEVALRKSDIEHAKRITEAVKEHHKESTDAYGRSGNHNLVGYLGEIAFAKYLSYTNTEFIWHGWHRDKFNDTFDFFVNNEKIDIKSTTWMGALSIPNSVLEKTIRDKCKIIKINITKDMDIAFIKGEVPLNSFLPSIRKVKSKKHGEIEFSESKTEIPLVWHHMSVPAMVSFEEPQATKDFLEYYSRPKHNRL